MVDIRVAPETYEVMQPYKGPAKKDAKPSEAFSWMLEKDPSKPLAATVRRIVQTQNRRLWNNTLMESLYCNTDLTQPYVSQPYSGGPNPVRSDMPRQAANFIKVYTDTLAGKLVQSNSRVQTATIGGDWQTFKLARKLNHILDAEWTRGKLFRECSRVVQDALKVGCGFLYVGEDEDRDEVCFERWYYNELFVDPLDSAYGQPTMLFRMRYIERDTALALWVTDNLKPKERARRLEIISKAPAAPPPMYAWTPYATGMIALYEAWSLPMGDRTGRHVICFENGTLIDDEWKHEHFPVVVFRASNLPLGWYGQGFAEHAAGAQIKLNEVAGFVSQSARLGLAPYWVVAGNADISVKQLNNVPGHIVTSNGPAPQWVVPEPFSPTALTYMQHLERYIGVIYGINEIESSGAAPQSRYDSNPALVQLQDAWMARHTILLKSWSEDFFLDVAYRTIESAQRIAKRAGSYPVIASKGDRAWAMDWKDFVQLKRESYRLSLAAEAALPLTPNARKKLALEMKAEGLVSPEEALKMMMGPPDLEAATARITAYENNADWLIEQLFEGVMPELSEFQKPEVVWEKVAAAALQAHDYGAPDDVLANFDTFGAAVLAKLNAKQAAMMPPAQPGAGPNAAGGIPVNPVSSLGAGV